MRYYLIAGEASGDLHASNLMKALKEEDPEAEFRFFGGEKMEAVGGTLVKHYREMAYMGFIPVLLHARTILNNMRMCKEDIKEWRPDVVVLVDYPGFNLKIAEYVHGLDYGDSDGDSDSDRVGDGVNHKKKRPKVYYYISPKIWAWKEYRIKNIRRDVDELFSILPFEVKWFADRNYPIHYVGNPCVDAIFNGNGNVNVNGNGNENGNGNGNENGNVNGNGNGTMRSIALLAGSRKQEIKDNLTKMLTVASEFKDYELVLAGAPSIDRSFYDQFIPEGVKVRIEFGKTYEILRNASAALVTSGTATLETAIIGTPQVVCYYMRPAWLFKKLRRFLKVKYVSLVNLVCDKEAVRELVAADMNVENLRNELAAILPGGSKREQMLKDYAEMNRILGGPGASARAAKKMVELSRPTPGPSH